jgi:hypothetical protein
VDPFLKSLSARRTIVDAELEAERNRAAPDGERLVALRRMRQQLGVQIAYIRREGRQIAEVMVVRKPRRLTGLTLKPVR